MLVRKDYGKLKVARHEASAINKSSRVDTPPQVDIVPRGGTLDKSVDFVLVLER